MAGRTSRKFAATAEIASVMTQRGRKLFLIRLFFYLDHLAWKIVDVLPQFMRSPLFKCIFKSIHYSSTIDYGCYVRYPWKVSIGANSILNRGCRIYASHEVKAAEIVIGDNVAIA